ncbi:hypothetical protein BJP40_00725 [Streptomyces sp. CC53]|uniref:DUF4350 domain-containing protein n=1 Tax=unclassified Streptomyces TaxID=2593676 RepID=UPI0008DD2D4D|nr:MULTISPECIES: DUF4350 domain-containing protein [unclassified Streptomyces]OII59821.1 hypothetical protein BJP40_00725 [Streptomyces sp. CC53]
MTATSTSLSPGGRQVWARARGVLLVLALIVAAGIALALARSSEHHGRLDPRSADRNGSLAVAELLQDRGVSTRVVTSLDEAVAAAGPQVTLLVAGPDLLTDGQQTALRERTATAGGRTVLVAAGWPSTTALAPGVTTDLPSESEVLQPACTLPEAVRAGAVRLGGERYEVGAGTAAESCYAGDGLPTLVKLQDAAGGDTVLLGSPDILFNHRLSEEGNASLALQLLGSREHLVWFLPSPADSSAGGDGDSDTPGGGKSFFDLIPSGWLWGTLQLVVAGVLAAIWRGRRLGPLVMERLPVAIRASEATEGRARLYHRADARDRASAVLRSAARTRLAPLVGVPTRDAHSPHVLLPALSARLADRQRDVQSLLFGPAPTDDTTLVRLADQLDALEREVRTS